MAFYTQLQLSSLSIRSETRDLNKSLVNNNKEHIFTLGKPQMEV